MTTEVMNFKLINDCGLLNVPLVELVVFPFKANVLEWFTSEGTGSAKLALGANFYNNKLSVWEPLIEKWGISVDVSFKPFSPTTNSTKQIVKSN